MLPDRAMRAPALALLLIALPTVARGQEHIRTFATVNGNGGSVDVQTRGKRGAERVYLQFFNGAVSSGCAAEPRFAVQWADRARALLDSAVRITGKVVVLRSLVFGDCRAELVREATGAADKFYVNTGAALGAPTFRISFDRKAMNRVLAAIGSAAKE